MHRWAKNNPNTELPKESRLEVLDPAEDWQVVLRCQEPLEILSAYKYLWTLVLVEAEAFLYRTEKSF